MFDQSSKKAIMFHILEILKEKTDENHRMRQSEIMKILKDSYGITVDKKTVKSDLVELGNLGYDIEYTETHKMVKNRETGEMEETSILSDFYLVREFSDAELRLLIDSLMFSRHIPYDQCMNLVKKLEKLSNEHFRSRVSYIHAMPKDRTDNKQLFYNIDIIDEAIEKNKKISFKYLEYGKDKKQHVKCREDGTERLYVVSPYQMAAKEGKYYLICNYDKYDDVSNYRVDRITQIEILDETAKPFNKLRWSDGKRFNMKEYMQQHIYMYSSKDTRIKFRIVKPMISDMIDMFGEDVRFYDETDNKICVSAKVNEQAMIQFAQNFAPDVEILEPEEIREKVKAGLWNGWRIYE